MADAHRMVSVGGIRYRPEDAKRLGLVADTPPAKARTEPAEHKARLEPGSTKKATSTTPRRRRRARAADDSAAGEG